MAMIPEVLYDDRLPPLWDGEPIRWQGWMPPMSGLIVCGRGGIREDTACPKCREPWNPWHNHALLKHDRMLSLERCPVCSLTLVTETDWQGHEQVRELDETDYEVGGSHAQPEPRQPMLF